MNFTLNNGNTAWMLTSTALVLLMTPALAFFYGGMVRTKSVLNMMMMSFVTIGTVGTVWAIYDYGITFGPASSPNALFGNPSGLFMLNGVSDSNSLAASVGVPFLVMVMFEVVFAIITVALISGSIADRTKFGAWVIFSAVWVTVVYGIIAHAVWGGGLLGPLGPIAKHMSVPIDFAGGTVVHINAGAAGLALAIVIGKRKGFGKEVMRPHNVPFVMLGAALLWFGWFGFNAGSEFASDATAGRAFTNTTLAPAIAMLGWILVEWIRDRKPTSLGAASGIVAGLVAITPAAASVDTTGALFIGLIAGIVCAFAVSLKYKFGFDDSLDVVGVHFVGGWIGTLLIGFFANFNEGTTWAPNVGATDGSPIPLNGVFYGGGWMQLGTQAVVAGFATLVSFSLTLAIGYAIKYTIGFRIKEAAEISGIDLAEHGETAYEEAK